MFRAKGALGGRGFPAFVSQTTAPAQLCCCANCSGLLGAGLMQGLWPGVINYKLLVTKREKIFFSAQLRLKTSLSELCWRPHASLWGWWCLALSSLGANSGSKPWGGC